MDWQPIETAPKDGTWVLLSDGQTIWYGQYGWDEEGDAVFFADGPGIRDCTHWMPLPEPPK